MDEILQKLLEAEILSPETKAELEGAFASQLEEAVDTAKKEAADAVELELKDQWITERDALIEAIDTKVGEYLSTEVEELKEDVERFRDLEAESAEKLVEAKAEMSVEVKADIAELVEKLDAFLEIRLSEELEELRESIDEVQKNEFGRKIFEGVVAEYRKSFVDDEGVESELREAREQLSDTSAALEEAEKRAEKLERAAKLDTLLTPLGGRQKEVMEAILVNVATEQLDEGYKTFIGRVLKETEEADEKEDEVLAEGSEEDNKDDVLEEGTKVTGDSDDIIEEGADDDAATTGLTPEALANLRRVAGIK